VDLKGPTFKVGEGRGGKGGGKRREGRGGDGKEGMPPNGNS